ncbi:ribonuclease [Asanoa sp. NPDC049573]|uniref:ribonuclease n=1 Tax=Asanoa sp. NPDC049573 TaxID=3155396 RepID=UPI003428EB36
MTTTPEQGSQRQHREDALERGEVFQDAEGRQTTDPRTAMENADSENDRNEERLRQGDVGPGIPEE